MTKKVYLKPAMQMAAVMQQTSLLGGSVNRVSGNSTMGYGGGSGSEARAGENNSEWDDFDD